MSFGWLPPFGISLGKSQYRLVQISYEGRAMHCLSHAVEIVSLAGERRVWLDDTDGVPCYIRDKLMFVYHGLAP